MPNDAKVYDFKQQCIRCKKVLLFSEFYIAYKYKTGPIRRKKCKGCYYIIAHQSNKKKIKLK